MKEKKIILISVILILILLPVFKAASNESTQAKKLIDNARQDIIYMQSRNISIMKANESYYDALQIYSAQVALENLGKKTNYKLATEYALEVDAIKNIAFKSNDELNIFKETFANTQKEINLSEMQEDYDKIINSFEEERFEETLELIDKGYEKLSEVQASQTTLKLFYASTSEKIKDFFMSYWIELSIGAGAIIIFLLIFGKVLSKLRIRVKLSNFFLQKKTISDLIKKIQHDYFKGKGISRLEYEVKLKKFAEMIRDIDRQISLLKEDILKLSKNKLKPISILDKPKKKRKKKGGK